MQATERITLGFFAFITAVSTAFSDDLTISSFSPYAGQTNILLQATGNITFTGGTLSFPDLPSAGQLVVQAGNNITVENGTGISLGANWTVTMVAGTVFSGTTPPPGNDGIYLNGNAYLQSQNGDINLWATNEIIVTSGDIRTTGGGNIGVMTEFGNVNSGSSTIGYDYLTTAPYYRPDLNLGGISTAAGGNLTINAGGDVVSFPTTTTAAGDPGTGAFGPEPGNVTIDAGGNVYGHYVMMNGLGSIGAGQNIGIAVGNQNVALSLAKGSWSLNASNGSIYLQEVRNPNGVFNKTTNIHGQPTAGNHLFDYDPQASVILTASNGIYLTGNTLPRPNGAVPLLMPPQVVINAGSNGVTLQIPTATDGVQNNDVILSDYYLTLFPSPYGNLQISTVEGGGLTSANANGTTTSLLMSDSAQTHWSTVNSGPQPFSSTDHGSVPPELNNPNPVVVNLSGSMQNVSLQTSKQTQVTVAGNMLGCSFYGENLHASDVTSINVGGQIYNTGSFTSVTLDQNFPSLPSADTPLANELPPGTLPSSWYLALALAVNPALLPTQSLSGDSLPQLLGILTSASAFPGLNYNTLAYDPNTKTLTAVGPLSSSLLAALQSPTLTVVRYDSNGNPLLDANGHFVTDTITWTPVASANYSEISSLYTQSQGTPPLGVGSGAYIVGGTGTFDVSAGSISLGNAYGILSLGNGKLLNVDYSFLTPYITSGATINVTVTGDLDMPGSAIAALGGGNVNVTSTGGAMNLGSQDLAVFEGQIMNATHLGLGIYTSGGGNVNVMALGTIYIDSSRIATFDGGNIFIESYTGSVNAGSGGSTFTVPVNVFSPAAVVGEPDELVYANGIVATTLINPSQIPGSATEPGNITVLTPEGDIAASQGGILQEVLDGSLAPGPTITLTAGTFGPPVYVGNIFLGNFGVIGETVVLEATGIITGPSFSTSIAQTNGVLTVSWNANGIPLTAQEIPGFAIETSTDLVNWTVINPSVTANADGSLSFQSPIPSNSICGFYRVLWQ